MLLLVLSGHLLSTYFFNLDPLMKVEGLNVSAVGVWEEFLKFNFFGAYSSSRTPLFPIHETTYYYGETTGPRNEVIQIAKICTGNLVCFHNFYVIEARW